MEFETLIMKETGNCMTLTLNRLKDQNSINLRLLQEINAALDIACKQKHCHMILIEGQQGIFCTGMDLNEIVQCDEKRTAAWTASYMATLKRFTQIPKVVVSCVDGKAIAGGVGLVAASDIAVATPAATFKLSEVLWGLLPAMIAPYLIRRTGFQKTYAMALTAKTISAKEARECQLVDEVHENPEECLQDLLRRFGRLDDEIVLQLKSYFRQLWIIDDQMEAHAIQQTTALLCKPGIKKRLVK